MDRKEFLNKLGVGAAFVLTGTCILSCGGDDEMEGPQPRTDVDFTIDLTEAANSDLLDNGGFKVFSDELVVVARTMTGEYVAVTQVCSHEQTLQVQYAGTRFLCTTHGAEFSETGEPLNEVTDRTLLVYNTELTGDSLRVFS